MIPLQLALTNFLSYREPVTIDLGGVHLACVSGLNGAGKSSLLDAITWALFGQSRSKSDDDLVNRLAAAHGESAEVRLVFELEACVYRVIRRKKAGRPVELEFQMAMEDGRTPIDEMNWKTMSEGRSRDTQAAIQQALNMNYDVFINASFLLQGKADEFTTRTPNQRKEILADLLGVSQWELYREAAVARRRAVETELQTLDARLNDIEQELGEQTAREAALVTAQTELTQLEEKLQIQEQLLTQMRRNETALRQQRQTVKNLADSVASVERALTERRQTLAQRATERASYQALLEDAEQIGADFAAFQEAEQQLSGWQAKGEAYHQIQQAQRPHELVVERERSSLEQRLQALKAEAEAVAAMQTERVDLVDALEANRGRLAELEAELTKLAEGEAVLRDAQSRLQKLESERQLLQQERDRLVGRRQQIDQQKQEQETVAANLAAATASLERLTIQGAEIAEERAQLSTAKGERTALEVEQPRLKEAMDKIVARIEGLRQETDDICPLCGQSLSEAHRRAVLEQLEQEGKQLGDAYRRNRGRIAELGEEVGRLEQHLKQTGRVEHDVTLQQQRQARAEARLAEIERLLTEWQVDGAVRLAELERRLADDATLRAERERVEALVAQVAVRPAREKERAEQQRRCSNSEARLAQIDQAIQQWDGAGQAALVDVQARLEQGNYAVEAQATLADLAEQAAALGYDPAAHEVARQRHLALKEAPTRYQALKEAQAAVRPLDDALADLKGQIAEQEDNLARLREQHDAAAAQLAALEADGGDLEGVEKEVLRLREEVVQANRRLGRAQQQLAVLDNLREQQARYQTDRTEITQHIQRLKVLEKACGRNGVQALLIEQALPEIEESANSLLERLTGGRMYVHFETQRQLKSRDGLAETLDIHIRDEAGERPYENFSGGEQFRVNFAIRLALSKLLAKRAGARLQTLVIDEGFGSQDPAGRQRLVEAINTIQDEFKRILVITHIDELRDVFPARIEVEKTARGSIVTIQ